MRKGRFGTISFLNILFFIIGEYSLAAAGIGSFPDNNPVIPFSQTDTAGFHQICGEVMSINAGNLIISEAGVCFNLKLAPEVKIYCNGLAANWQALQPVTVNAFFDARAVLDRRNRVVMIDGQYRGEECIIQSWDIKDKDKEGLYLRFLPIGGSRERVCQLKKDARLPKENWLTRGELIYVLYDREGKIRGVFLPD